MRSLAQLGPVLVLIWLTGIEAGQCATLSIQSSATGPGSSVPVTVAFTNESGPISGLQFDLSFDGTALSVTSVIGAAARASGKAAYVSAPASGRVRVVIWELNQDPISDGVLVNLFVNVTAGAKLGAYPIHFEDALATGPDGKPVEVSTSDGGLTVEAISPAPVLAQGVLNGASLLSGPVAPGEMITIMGSAIGSSVVPDGITFDGIAAPLLYVGAEQVNAVVPFGITGRTITKLEFSSPDGAPFSILLPVASSAPGIFTLSASGAGRGAILNQDSTVNSPDNPAARGSIVVLYATGAGQTTPPGVDGAVVSATLPKPLLPVSVQIGGADAAILYAGAAPQMISGIIQVNCRVPLQIDPGTSVPVVLTLGSESSATVSLAVR